MLWPAPSASCATEPSGRVTVRVVHEADWVAAGEMLETWRTVDPSLGEEETSAGMPVVTPPPPPPAEGGVTTGVWFAAANVNGAVLLPVVSCRAFSAGTA